MPTISLLNNHLSSLLAKFKRHDNKLAIAKAMRAFIQENELPHNALTKNTFLLQYWLQHFNSIAKNNLWNSQQIQDFISFIRDNNLIIHTKQPVPRMPIYERNNVAAIQIQQVFSFESCTTTNELQTNTEIINILESAAFDLLEAYFVLYHTHSMLAYRKLNAELFEHNLDPHLDSASALFANRCANQVDEQTFNMLFEHRYFKKYDDNRDFTATLRSLAKRCTANSLIHINVCTALAPDIKVLASTKTDMQWLVSSSDGTTFNVDQAYSLNIRSGFIDTLFRGYSPSWAHYSRHLSRAIALSPKSLAPILDLGATVLLNLNTDVNDLLALQYTDALKVPGSKLLVRTSLPAVKLETEAVTSPKPSFV